MLVDIENERENDSIVSLIKLLFIKYHQMYFREIKLNLKKLN